MKNYLNEQSAGMIIRNSVGIYLTNFKALFLIYCLPVLPFMLLEAYSKTNGQVRMVIIAAVIKILVSILVFLPMTVAVSDISLGNRPTIGRSYRCIFSKSVGSFFITYLLLVIVIAVGFIFLVVPGLLFLIWYALTFQVVLLERLSGWKALKRSKELGVGFYWRNYGVLFLTNIICFIFIMILTMSLGGASGYLGGTFFPDFKTFLVFLEFVWGAIGLVAAPPMLIAPVLIYYDMRARKEAYDINTLAEDLAR
ncbi:hypothetical protein B0F87_11346 [Methylobacter tundripaludum]|uniref:Glycerophosphoryl diester phosphodiesterase membrane domain-containing protein n=1 Tax=Methylobacter tundripaludum TaxID=173365 RepID=A0A2S6H8Z5_9GAMM|nr:hypothetical protein [Methylobacter tundripaludum]PPK73935.1 hypothetical protein B0F87_11346 [Methylobacter tundripaludum]